MESATRTATIPAAKPAHHPVHLSLPDRLVAAVFGARGLGLVGAALITAASLIAAAAGHTAIAVLTIACLVPLITPVTLACVFELSLVHGGLIVAIVAGIGSLIGLVALIRAASVLDEW